MAKHAARWGLAVLAASVGIGFGSGLLLRQITPQQSLSANDFTGSVNTCKVRFEYYQDKKEKEPLFQTNGASYSWLYQAGRLNRYLQRKAWKQIQAPVLIFQSAEDHLVSKPEQVRFVVKLARRGLTSGTMIIVPGTKHEIYGSGSRILRGYWKRIFAFLEEPQVEKDGSGK